MEAVRWDYRPDSEQGPGVQLGEGLEVVDVPDRGLAVALGHYLLDKYAEKAVGRMSIEIHVHPPEQDVEDESLYEVSGEALEQARELGIEGDVEAQVKRMAARATPYTHERAAPDTHKRANLQHGGFALRIEANKVTWLGRVDPGPSRPRKGR